MPQFNQPMNSLAKKALLAMGAKPEPGSMPITHLMVLVLHDPIEGKIRDKHEIRELVDSLASLGEDEALNVGLAVREAVINAMMHGNRQQPELAVGIRLTVAHGVLRAVITDEGAGFDPATAEDPTTAENLLRESGRGLLLMEAFVDRIEFRRRSNGGMEVEMTKALPSPELNGNESP